MEKNQKKISEQLIAEILRSNLGVMELSRRSGLGKSEISRLISGERRPTARQIDAIAVALGVRLEQLKK